MKRRDLLLGGSMLTTSRALAQPMPLIGPVGDLPSGPGPLFSLSVGPPGVTLDANFMVPGTLPTGVTLTRGSTATYFDATGTMQTTNGNTPRWDYNPSTLVLNGLLVEETRTNVALNSGDFSNASWLKNAAGAGPVTVTGNQAIAPDGTLTAAKAVYPTVSAANSYCVVYVQPTLTAVPYSLSVYLKGASGGERLYLSATPNGTLYYSAVVTLTTSWQRFVLNTPALTAATWYIQIGTDLRDASETATPVQTIYMWGGQLEQGAFATSYIPTTAATVTRSADVCTIASVPGRNTAAESYQAEFMVEGESSAYLPRVVSGTGSSHAPIYIGDPAPFNMGAWDGGPLTPTANTANIMTVAKAASAWSAATHGSYCLNAGAIVANSTMVTGYPEIVAVKLMGDAGADNTNGWIRRFRYWPRVLSNTELQQVTI